MTGGLIGLLIQLLVLMLVLGLIWYIIGLIPLPEPFGNVARIVFAVIAVLILISLLLGVGPISVNWGR